MDKMDLNGLATPSAILCFASWRTPPQLKSKLRSSESKTEAPAVCEGPDSSAPWKRRIPSATCKWSLNSCEAKLVARATIQRWAPWPVLPLSALSVWNSWHTRSTAIVNIINIYTLSNRAFHARAIENLSSPAFQEQHGWLMRCYEQTAENLLGTALKISCKVDWNWPRAWKHFLFAKLVKPWQLFVATFISICGAASMWALAPQVLCPRANPLLLDPTSIRTLFPAMTSESLQQLLEGRTILMCHSWRRHLHELPVRCIWKHSGRAAFGGQAEHTGTCPPPYQQSYKQRRWNPTPAQPKLMGSTLCPLTFQHPSTWNCAKKGLSNNIDLALA